MGVVEIGEVSVHVCWEWCVLLVYRVKLGWTIVSVCDYFDMSKVTGVYGILRGYDYEFGFYKSVGLGFDEHPGLSFSWIVYLFVCERYRAQASIVIDICNECENTKCYSVKSSNNSIIVYTKKGCVD